MLPLLPSAAASSRCHAPMSSSTSLSSSSSMMSVHMLLEMAGWALLAVLLLVLLRLALGLADGLAAGAAAAAGAAVGSAFGSSSSSNVAGHHPWAMQAAGSRQSLSSGLAGVRILQAIGAHQQQARMAGTAHHLAVCLCTAAGGLPQELQLAGQWRRQHLLLAGWHRLGWRGQQQQRQRHLRRCQGEQGNGNTPTCLLPAAAVTSGVALAQGSNQQLQQQHSNVGTVAAVQQR
jgi:hypothetical protein